MFLKPAITVQQARRLLGKDAAPMSDDDLLNAIVLLSSIARFQLNSRGARTAYKKLGL